tara:strand:+ start:61 stop:189 length:129 start_codon:yes stop_codon:yes gene_type:complete
MSELALQKEEELIETLTEEQYDKYMQEKALAQWWQQVEETEV